MPPAQSTGEANGSRATGPARRRGKGGSHGGQFRAAGGGGCGPGKHSNGPQGGRAVSVRRARTLATRTENRHRRRKPAPPLLLRADARHNRHMSSPRPPRKAPPPRPRSRGRRERRRRRHGADRAGAREAHLGRHSDAAVELGRGPTPSPTTGRRSGADRPRGGCPWHRDRLSAGDPFDRARAARGRGTTVSRPRQVAPAKSMPCATWGRCRGITSTTPTTRCSASSVRSTSQRPPTTTKRRRASCRRWAPCSAGCSAPTRHTAPSSAPSRCCAPAATSPRSTKALNNHAFLHVQCGEYATAVPLRWRRSPSPTRSPTGVLLVGVRCTCAIALAGTGRAARRWRCSRRTSRNCPALDQPYYGADHYLSAAKVRLLVGDAGRRMAALRRAATSPREARLDSYTAPLLELHAEIAEAQGDTGATLRAPAVAARGRAPIARPRRPRSKLRSLETSMRLREQAHEHADLLETHSALESRVAERTAELAAEVEERRRAEERAEYLARHDWLTDLPNRRGLHDALEEALADARASNGIVGALFVDIDRFKSFNDAHGHLVADQVLRIVAERFRGLLAPPSMVFRFGGDEFLLLVRDALSPQQILRVAQSALDVLDPPVVVERTQLRVACSVGIAVCPGGRGRRRRPAAQGGPRVAARQGARAQPRGAARPDDRARDGAPDAPRAGPAARAGAPRDAAALPAAVGPAARPGRRHGGAAALGPPGLRDRAAERIRPAGRGARPHLGAGRVGAEGGLPRVGPGAQEAGARPRPSGWSSGSTFRRSSCAPSR